MYMFVQLEIQQLKHYVCMGEMEIFHSKILEFSICSCCFLFFKFLAIFHVKMLTGHNKSKLIYIHFQSLNLYKVVTSQL